MSTVRDGLPPEWTTFVGRSTLLADCARLLVDDRLRLINLIGPGGVGKTRVALAAARALAPRYAHGAVFVDLTAIRAADDRLEAAIAEALGIPDNAAVPVRVRLIEHLRCKALLLVLDNCEQLLDLDGDCELPRLISTLLKVGPNLQVMATSRCPLGVSGEQLVRIPPMGVSAGFAHDEEKTEALRLLLDRAEALDRPVAVQDYPLANELCRLLDGLPLAIELAAGRLDTLTLEEITDRCEGSLRLLVRPGHSEQRHHQTLWATIGWSYDLLKEVERRTWVVLSVFEGGFDLAAAEGVCAAAGIDRDAVLDLLSHLVKTSLLTAQPHCGRTYYRMRELDRRFCREVTDITDLCATRGAHAAYYRDLVQRWAREWYGPQESAWVERIGQSTHNIRAAVEHYLERGDWSSALGMVCEVTQTCTHICVGQINEARRLLQLGLDAHPDEPSELQVAALAMLSYFAILQGLPNLADPLLAEAHAVAAQLGASALDSPTLLITRGVHQWLTDAEGEVHTALATLRAAAEAADDAGSRAVVAMFAAFVGAFDADEPTARDLTTAFWVAVEHSGADSATSWALFGRSVVELRFGAAVEALVLLQRGLAIQLNGQETWGPAWGLWLRAIIAARMGDHVWAARLFGAAKTRLDAIEVTVSGLLPWWRLQLAAEPLSKSALGEQYSVEFALGAALPYDEAMALALLDRLPHEAEPTCTYGLTTRQLQIAELVAGGLTNQEIGDALHISARTVETHIVRIVSRLGLDGTGKLALANWYTSTVHAGAN